MEAQGADLDWISAQVAAIFQSPTWTATIARFVDSNCGAFEDLDENKFEYTTIHNAFKQLVEELLDAHLQGLQVTTEQFALFCERGLNGQSQVHRDLIGQLLSLDDFLVFKAMMVKRNAELYREAVENTASAALSGSEQAADPQYDHATQMAEEELAQLEAKRLQCEQLEAQLLEAERLEAQRRYMEAELQLAMAISKQLKMKLQLMERLSEALETLAQMKELEAALAAEAEAAEASETVNLQPLGMGAPESTEQDEWEANLQCERAERAIVVSRQEAASREAAGYGRAPAAEPAAAPVQQGPTDEERRARAEYLKKQRDILVAKKNQERDSQLSAVQQANNPAGARAAEAAVRAAQAVAPGSPSDAGKRLVEELSSPTAAAAASQDADGAPAATEMRKMLMRQLKGTFSMA